MEKLLSRLSQIIIGITIVLIPLFFLPTTQEFFQTNKFYLLALSVILSLIVWVIRVGMDKKISWRKSPLNLAIIILLITQALSVILSSPNKLSALISLPSGFAAIFFLSVFYFILINSYEHDDVKKGWKLLRASAVVVALIAIVFFFNPFKNVALPPTLSFLKSPFFNTFGNPLELVLFLGFFVIHEIVDFIQKLRAGIKQAINPEKDTIVQIITSLILLVGFLSNIAILTQPQRLGIAPFRLPPLSISWYAAVETLKNPTSALFGVGVDNFASIFTKVKALSYNQTPLWEFNFTRGASHILHLWTETGLLGLSAFILILVLAIRQLLNMRKKDAGKSIGYLVTFAYLLIVLLSFPSSLMVLFLLFLYLAALTIMSDEGKKKTIDFAKLMPVYIAGSVIILLACGGISYLLGRAYASEYFFRKSMEGLSSADGPRAYNNMVRAIQYNPYNEGYHLVFSQLNLLFANNIAAASTTDKEGNAQLSDKDRQAIAQTIQQAIAEAKAVVQLNPQKAQNWENLAVIYRNILNVAQGADQWSIGSYQRAVTLDPINPSLRLNLGGVYYSLKNYGAAAQMFGQAISFKPDWANAYYNLAWTFFQNGNYSDAVLTMQKVITLVDNKSPDAIKAKGDLEEFKKKLPKQDQQEATPEATTQPTIEEQQPLVLPQKPQPVISPKIDLPEGVEPPATSEATVE